MPTAKTTTSAPGQSRNPVVAQRLRKGLVQRELAERAGITRETLARVEIGREPTLSTALALARALGTTVEKLFGGER
jgi:transcriptional regulator with XRE-family HTH domain